MSANWSRNAFVYLLIIVAAATLFINIYRPGDAPQQISLTQLATQIKAGEVEAVVVQDAELRVTLKEGDAAIISRRESEVPITQTPVSYTHLDVYKRQTHRQLAHGVGNLGDAGVHALPALD